MGYISSAQAKLSSVIREALLDRLGVNKALNMVVLLFSLDLSSTIATTQKAFTIISAKSTLLPNQGVLTKLPNFASKLCE